jgi:hypothetical protein
VLEGRDLRMTSAAPLRPGRPLPGTLDPFSLRFTVARPAPDGSSVRAGA